MATAIYNGFLIHGLATMAGGQFNNAKLTPSIFVMIWCLVFDLITMAALVKFLF